MYKCRFLLIIAAALATIQAMAQDMLVFRSENLHCAATVLVFSPSGRSAERAVPTLFLLHGYSGKYSDWSSHMDLQAVSDSSGFRIICPDGFYASWYLNNASPAGMQWRTFFWEECWPALEKKYGFSPEKTFIDGLSMGGHGAMNLFLDHPDRFRGAGSRSGILALRPSGGSKELIPKILGAESIYDEVCEKESAVNRLSRIEETCGKEGAANKLIIVSCGTEDKFIVATNEFAAKCREMGLRHIVLTSPGKHRWTYWTWLLPYHLQLFREEIQ